MTEEITALEACMATEADPVAFMALWREIASLRDMTMPIVTLQPPGELGSPA